MLVMINRPATIQKIVNVDLPRPRDLDSPGYLQSAIESRKGHAPACRRDRHSLINPKSKLR